ncbi:LLM class flavin-dependent oxidoreductase [Nonomuraea endophytica]|uniref:LLM class flavin-dependent oxidoreductase n=1 Tax=Nonomuraea endophytica TaxID=714136 RepID=UPI0037C79DFA
MRFSINIPNFGEFADARNVAKVAAAAEESGWDALFVWDHVVHRKQRIPFGDPWMLLTAAALATTRLRLGTLVTPVARRRPQQLARQVATLDSLSGGRVIFGAGLGAPIEEEYGAFGESTDPIELAARLDEGLDLMTRYWSGEPVTHKGRFFEAHDVALLPATVQQPRPPVWVAGYWPNRRPMRRAARWDGAVPLFESARHGQPPHVEEVRDLIAFIREERARLDRTDPFDIVAGGVTPTDPTQARAIIAPLVEEGVTWWDERQHIGGDTLDKLVPVLRRIEHGPPAL